MRINEIIIESEQLEEGWKQNIAAAALAAGAALGGGYSGDAEAQSQPRASASQTSKIPVLTDFAKLREATVYLAIISIQMDRGLLDKNEVAGYNYGMSIIRESSKYFNQGDRDEIDRTYTNVRSTPKYLNSRAPAAIWFDNLDGALRSARVQQPQTQQPKAAPVQAQPNPTNNVQTIKSSNGIYKGEVVNGKPHGKGTLKFDTGNQYTGEFKNGKYDGKGTYTFNDGRKVSGEWKDGKPVK